ncbi:MAG TPA: biotin-dependent carboxyltransferase family protein [Vicinamibacterales bacterium]|nr:biotin-dependent carboxyltransferase family protein [Vicinamibacterales bacterium]
MTSAIHVIRPGLQTTVQDLGRWGFQAAGVPVAGPMDPFSHRLANLLVGNPMDAALLEITLIGPELEFEGPARIAVCGAEFDITAGGDAVPTGISFHLGRGARLQFGRRRAGARAYLAIAGGVQTPPVLRSRATHVVSAMGGLQGRALIAGDRVPVVPAAPSVTVRRASGFTLPATGRARVRLLPGPQADWFDATALKALTSVSFRVSPRSNRMGYRLEGPPLARSRSEEPISAPLAFGAVQVPAAGEPILLMADRQTAGGYPQIAAMIAADWPLAGQLAPGDFIEFAFCTRQEAASALIARERPLLRVAESELRA